MVTLLLGKKRLQRDGVKQAYFGWDLGSFAGEPIGWTFKSARTVFARGIVPELVSGGFGKEVGFGRKDLGLEPFGFAAGMDAFDIGMGVGAGRGVEVVFGLKTAEPFAGGAARTLAGASGRLDALFESGGDPLMAEGELRVAGADHLAAGWGGGRRNPGVVYHTPVSPGVRRRGPLL